MKTVVGETLHFQHVNFRKFLAFRESMTPRMHEYRYPSKLDTDCTCASLYTHTCCYSITISNLNL